ncbi:MAG: DNA translocase FtsK [Lachnospiraceae bacterium]|nr:DNA translocase FtsK [Lachnospiraceae bacterium]
MITLLLICLGVLTGRSIIRLITESSKEAADSLVENIEIHNEEVRRDRRKRRRNEGIHYGRPQPESDAFSKLKIEPTVEESDEMKELTVAEADNLDEMDRKIEERINGNINNLQVTDDKSDKKSDEEYDNAGDRQADTENELYNEDVNDKDSDIQPEADSYAEPARYDMHSITPEYESEPEPPLIPESKYIPDPPYSSDDNKKEMSYFAPGAGNRKRTYDTDSAESREEPDQRSQQDYSNDHYDDDLSDNGKVYDNTDRYEDIYDNTDQYDNTDPYDNSDRYEDPDRYEDTDRHEYTDPYDNKNKSDDHSVNDENSRKRKVASSTIPEGIVVKDETVDEYVLPDPAMLKAGKRGRVNAAKEQEEISAKLKRTLASFGVKAEITGVSQGPTVTRYELLPEAGVKVSKIVSLTDDLKLALAAESIRIEAPIPGKSAIGIEVPNAEVEPVMLHDLIVSDEFQNSKSRISFAVGKDIGGKPVVFDIAKMPHVLIAGATGAGKSVCINTIIMSILYKAKPDEVKLVMIDPKVVELSIYNGIPHLMIPVVTDPQKAAGALNWSVVEMDRRYNEFATHAVRDIKGYNAIAAREGLPPMFQLVVIVDELADLMMTAKSDVETAIVRLAQKARAAGIHLIIATQRPSVDVITGLIKANMPSRVAFTVTSGVDSRTILDMVGAEKLLGKGDMLFYPVGYPKPARVQGAFVSDEEVDKVASFIRSQKKEDDDSSKIMEEINAASVTNESKGNSNTQAASATGSDEDEIFLQAAEFAVNLDKETISIGLLQRKFRLGFNRAARIMDQLSEEGIVGEEMGTKGRRIVMTPEQFEEFKEERAI